MIKVDIINEVSATASITKVKAEQAVEAVLVGHAELKETAVIAHEFRPGEPQLVAYVVGQTSSPPTTMQLREFCRTHLPAHAVPASFVFLDALPLSASGKVDRQRLPSPQQPAADLPRTPTEAVIVQIWADQLRVKDIGIHDEFLALGGDSVLAMRIMSRLCEHFDIEVPLFVLLECHTPAKLAQVIDSLLSEDWGT